LLSSFAQQQLESFTYRLQRIGTAAEKQSVERELAELRERLAKVEGWKMRMKEIERELGNVLVQGGKEVEVSTPSTYVNDENRVDEEDGRLMADA